MIPRILVIDDEERMCWALERALSHEGYQVVTATRGLQGVEMALESEPSAAIINLPEGGFSLENLEKQLFIKALEKHNYNQTKAAKYLGISRPTLLYRMNKHGLKS